LSDSFGFLAGGDGKGEAGVLLYQRCNQATPPDHYPQAPGPCYEPVTGLPQLVG